MRKKDIEEKAIHEINGLILNEAPTLESNIKSNDKTPSFDGTITIHPLESETKRHLKIINVQVKGTQDSGYGSGVLKSFSLDVDDLNNYREADGCLLLVVQFDRNGKRTKIYYNKLLPYELARIFSSISHDQKKKSVPLSVLEPRSLEWLCHNYYEGYKTQKRSSDIVLKRGVLPNIPGDKIIISPENRAEKIDDLVGRESIAYEFDKLDNLSGICRAKIVGLNITRPTRISSSDGRIVYGSLQMTVLETDRKITFGDGFILFKNNNKFSFELRGNFSSRIKQLTFLRSLVQSGFFLVDNVKIQCSMTDGSKKIIAQLAIIYENVDHFLKAHGIKKDLALDGWSERDFKELYSFIVMINRGGLPSNEKIRKIGIGLFQKNDLALSAIEISTKSGKTVIEPIWHANQGNGGIDQTRLYELSSNIDGHTFKFRNLFLGLRYDCFLADDVDTEEMRLALRVEKNTAELVNWHLVQVLQAYDISGRRNLLEYCRFVIDELLKVNPNHTHHIINSLQIKLREGNTLSRSDKEHLIKLKESTTDKMTRISTELLLGEKDEARYHLRRLAKDDFNSFMSFPIAKFLS